MNHACSAQSREQGPEAGEEGGFREEGVGQYDEEESEAGRSFSYFGNATFTCFIRQLMQDYACAII